MPSQVLRIMSYNIQVGISTKRPHHYLTHSWKHILPHTQRLTNLDRVARLMPQNAHAPALRTALDLKHLFAFQPLEPRMR